MLPENLFFSEYVQKFQIDHAFFSLSSHLNLISISPEESAGNSYIPEIVKYFNSFS